jgi:hypothetical protein
MLTENPKSRHPLYIPRLLPDRFQKVLADSLAGLTVGLNSKISNGFCFGFVM